MKYKILLLNPVTRKNERVLRAERCQQKILPGMALWPPISLAYIAAILLQKFQDDIYVNIMDAEIENYTYPQMLEKIKEYLPDIVIVQGTTPTIYDDLYISKFIKSIKPSSIFVIFGSHATARPEDYLEGGADFAIMGEPEITSEEIVKALINKKIDNKEKLKDIPGIAFKNTKSIFKSPVRNVITNLDELPFPARYLLKNEKYIMPGINKPFTIIKTSRGCPYQCIYCTSRLYYGRKWRTRSPENIFEEIKYVINKYNIKTFLLHSDTFNFSEENVIKLCDYIINEKLDIRWLANSRTNHFTERMAAKMKEAGVWAISFGIESGSDNILRNIKKGATTDHARKAINICKKYGIQSIGYFMLGLPGENEDTLKQTIKFMKELDTDYIQYYIATPFPGTEFFDIAIQNRWIKEVKWDHLYNGLTDLIEYPHISNKKLLHYQKKAYRTFYFRPRKIIKELMKIRSISDIKNYFYTFLNFITIFIKRI